MNIIAKRILFIGIFLTIYVFINLWLGQRIWFYFGRFTPYLNNKVYWLFFLIISQSFILGKLMTDHIPVRLSRFLIVIGSYWLALMAILLLVILFTDVFMLIANKTTLSAMTPAVFSPPAAGLMIAVLTIGIFGYGWWNARNVGVKEYHIVINKSAGDIKNLTAVAISDLHLGSIVNKKRAEKLAAVVKEIKPDIILIAGDIVDEDPGPFIEQNMKQIFKEMQPPLGMYAVPGNHEYIGGKWRQIFDNLNLAGITVLRDETVLVGNSFYVTGRDDNHAGSFNGQERRSLKELTSGIDKDLPIILLDHQPSALEEAVQNGIDLQFSGHTHHGQFFPNNLLTQRIFECDWGYLKKQNLHLLVSCGYGTWGPPIRIGSHSEVLKIDISFK